MKKVMLIAALLALTVLQQGCHVSARADWFYKTENGGKVYKSRPGSQTTGNGNATDRVLRSLFNTKGGK